MALDSQDFELMKSVRAVTREAGEKTAQRLDIVIDAQKKLLASSEKALANDDRLVAAFNRMATAIEGLTQEVKGLREDLSPAVDKPKRLPAPEQR
jgi:hypothetical protein